jgi:hypothetical protein
MKRKVMMIEESLYEFAKRGRPKKRGRKPIKKKNKEDLDTWEIPDEDEEEIDPNEIDIDTSDMVDAEEIEIEEDVFDDKLMKLLSNEVKIPEIGRGTLKFRLKGNLDKILLGVPMVKLGTQNAFVFKLEDGSLKKIFLRDIVLEESEKPKNNRAYTINE